MYIGNGKYIGKTNQCFIIAEIGQNHQGDINLAKQMIVEAKKAGADCVKFQKTNLTEKFTRAALERKYDGANSWGKTYGEHKEFLEFSEEQFMELKEFSEKQDIIFSSSAMDVVSADFLFNLQISFIKIGSGDSNNLPMIEHLALKHIPLIISTGMIDMASVISIYEAVTKYHSNFCLLHCVSAYPTPYEDCNLNVIQSYQESFPNIPIGYSGHELGISVTLAAVALGAKVIERHFTLDKTWKGSDHSSSLTPSEFRTMVQQIRIIEAALGAPIKAVVPSEKPCMDKLQKSLSTANELNKGHVVSKDDIKIKVTDPKGINGLFFNQIIGQTINCDKNKDEPFLETDFNVVFTL